MKQGEIWLVNLDPTIGAEIRKTRPCVIMNDDSVGLLPLKIIAPLTDFKDHYLRVPWMVAINPDAVNNLQKPSIVDLFQVRCISEERLVRKVGVIDVKQISLAQEALKTVFGIR
jgi:mRNA interferase MazF